MNIGQECALIRVPPNAHLGSFGDTWECNAGYQAVQDRCVARGV